MLKVCSKTPKNRGKFKVRRYGQKLQMHTR